MFLFSVFRLNGRPGEAAVRARFHAIEEQYRVDRGHEPRCVRYYDEASGLGCHIVWQKFSNERVVRCTETRNRIVAFTGLPFGYTAVVGSVDPASIGPRLADAFLHSPSSIEKMHPPFCLVDFDKAARTIRIYTDVIGYTRTYRLDTELGYVVSNRSFAPFFVTTDIPTLSERGWATEQLKGYMFGELPALDPLKRNLAGARFEITPDRIESITSDAALSWFLQPSPDAMDGFDRLAREIDLLADFDDFDVALSGGRYSRASASFAFASLEPKVHGRTNYPPTPEKTVARELVQRTPAFARFVSDDEAVRDDGTRPWRAVPRKRAKLSDILRRARD